MFDKRLFSVTPGIGRLVAAKVAALWMTLIANIAFAVTVVLALADLLRVVDRNAPVAAFCQIDPNGGCVTPTPLERLAAFVPTPDGHAIAVYAAVFVVIAAVRYAATRAATHFGFLAAERVKLALRQKLMRKMLALGPSYSNATRTADVVQLTGEGIEQVQTFFELFLPQLFFSILAPVTLFVVLLPVNIPAAATLLVCAPLIVLIVGLVAMSAARVFKKYWGKYTDLGSTFLDDLRGLETLKIFDADEHAHAVMNRRAEEFRVMTMNVLQIQLRSLSVMDLVAYGGSAAGIIVALWQYLASDSVLPLTGFLLVVLLSADFFIPLRQLGSYFHVAMNGMTSSRKIFALLDLPEPEHGGRPLPAGDVDVTFDGVSFAYGVDTTDDAADVADATSGADAASDGGPGRTYALRGATFTARPRALTAIVGASGSGKSTAAGLISGRLTGYEGSLTLGGVELRDLTLDALLQDVTVVSATSHLFRGTLRENLLMARPDAGDDELMAALHAARIDDVVRNGVDGLDMPIADDGGNLSGGQRQRIALARGLLHDSAVYVFDEATSNVDVESERLILEAIHDLAAHKTVIMITHRMANAVDADNVVVFDRGTVAQTGPHDVLMADAAGVYARMFRTQSAVENLDGAVCGTPAETEAGVDAMTGIDATTNIGVAEQAGVTSADAERSVTERAVIDSSTAIDSPATADSSTGRLIARLLRVASPLRGFMTLAVVCGTVGHLAAAAIPVFGIFAVLALAGHPVWGLGFGASVAVMVVSAVLRGAMRYVEQYMNHNVAFRLLALFRDKAFGALRRLAPAKLAGRGKGDLIALITTDVELLEIFFAHTISPVVIAVVTSLVFAVALVALDPWYALLLVVAHLVVGAALPKAFAARVKPMGERIRRESSQLDDYVLDGMRGIDEIIRFRQGDRRIDGITSRTKSLWDERGRLSRANGSFAAIGGVLVELFVVAAVAVAWWAAAGTSLSIPESVIAVVLIASSFGPTLALSALPANLTQTFAAARRLFSLMDEAPAVVENGTEAPRYDGMAMDHVTFAYPQDGPASSKARPVLDDVSITVPKTGVLGIQGRSGAGKSTMLKLMLHYWDPQAGVVALSGVDIRDVEPHHRRRMQTMMTQETYLFDGTIRENLRIAVPDAGMGGAGHGDAATDDEGDGIDDTRLLDACRKASVDDLIASLPDGLDTQVGELGDRLSEGERQRIGLARMFLRQADLVLFDEPTSRLDAFNEAVILRSIRTLAIGSDANRDVDDADKSGDIPAARHAAPAVVLVSHRESAMRIADHVLHADDVDYADGKTC
ncbi:ATP-binding cassette domain-containing protein [Bifidobacterium sp. SMB2]|uniref:ATP-binding cassette domain-containing protein n=1 Tax=Bifidobacterium saimiriisciurei TaxID=2661627 RepID=A0ABX0CG81_9BIFI|nr:MULTISPECIES: ATP-binding cassette domain-containing protein [Bifidobacterium]NEG95250.1 ATP-binding cassette domain-containing protein [Bifidobacterium sp. SMB2]NEH11327.1 ATP-binding cassette domain-containing protein [Bifidobacterium saimiriisciurei]